MIIKFILFIFFVSSNVYAQDTTLRMANWLPPTHPWVTNIMIPWIEKVKIATEGRVVIDLLKAPLGPPPAHFDFAAKGIDEPFTDEEIGGIQGMQAMRDRVVVEEGIKNPTPRDFMQITGRGLLRNAWIGGPKDIADRIEEWWEGRACDGFVIGPTHQPGGFEDFVKYVIPELQKRGIYRKEYSGQTLRDHLGLKHPKIGAWHGNADAAE